MTPPRHSVALSVALWGAFVACGDAETPTPARPPTPVR